MYEVEGVTQGKSVYGLGGPRYEAKDHGGGFLIWFIWGVLLGGLSPSDFD